MTSYIGPEVPLTMTDPNGATFTAPAETWFILKTHPG